MAPCPNRSVKSSFTSSSAQRIASLGSNQTCDRACMVIWQQSAVISEPNLCASAAVADHVHIITTLPRTLSQAQLVEEIKESIVEMDQSARSSVSRFLLAARLRRFFGEPEPARSRAAVRRGTTRAPSHSHVSGGVSRAAAQARRRFRRAVHLGLIIIRARLKRAFSACFAL